MPTPRPRFLLGLLLLAGLLLLSACSSSLSPEELLARAQLALAEGDVKAAEIDVKSVLQAAPENARARALYGELYRRQLNPSAAVEEFERSLASRETPETRLQLAKALVESGNSAELLSDFEADVYASVKDEAEFMATVARALVAQREIDAARATLAPALSAGTDSDHVALTEAAFLLHLDDDPDGARRIARTVVDRNPRSDEAWSLLGAIALGRGDFAAAETYYGKATEANPYRTMERLQRVNALLRQGKEEAADRELRTLERALPNSTEVSYLRGQWLFDQGRFVDARDALARVLSVNPDHPGSLLMSANANLREGNLTTAERQLSRFLTLQPGHVPAGLLLATVWRELGEPGRSEEMAREVLKEEPVNAQALGILALALASQGEHAASANVYGELAQLHPDVAAIRIAAGSQQLVAGDSAAALEQLEAAVALDPDNATARERSIEAYMALKDLDAALAAADAYAERVPDDPRAAVYRGRVRLQREDTKAAQEEFQRALDLDPGNVAASGGIAALAILSENVDGAIAAFRTALEAHPGDLSTSMNLAVLLEQVGDTEGMLAVLQAAAAANEDAAAPRIALARQALSVSEPSEAIEWLEPIAGKADQDYRATQVLTQAYLVAEQPDAAMRSARRLLDQRPDDPQALALVARVETANRRPASAQRHLERALDFAPESVEFRKQLVESLLAQRKLGEAEAAIGKLPANVQAEPALLSVRGRLALAREDLQAAQDLLTAAFEQQPNTVNLLMLAGTQWRLGERDAVLRDLRSWVDEYPEDLAARNELGARLLANGDSAAAREQYELIVDQQPENVVALNNLAWLLREEAPDEALAYISRAVDLVPDNAQILDTYAMVELAAGDAEAALALVDAALAAAPDNSDVRYNRAQILVELGRGGEARSLLKALAEDPGFSLQAEAAALLERLSAP